MIKKEKIVISGSILENNVPEEVFTEGGRLRLERQASESQSLNLPHGLYYPRVNLQGKEASVLRGDCQKSISKNYNQ